MPQVHSQYQIGRKPFDTDVQVQRNGNELYVLLPSRKDSRNYWAGAGGLLLLAGYLFWMVIENEGHWFYLLLAIVITLGSVLVFVVGAFEQVGLYADGRNIRLLKKLFGYPVQTIENSLADFVAVELAEPTSKGDDDGMEILLSFSVCNPMRFGAELSGEEQFWLLNELMDYVASVRGEAQVSTMPA
ncbi:MAG: hypothetical protein U0Y68_11550 [Blastocatellia bacterium]